jgi:hypothetical protein
VPKVKGAFGKPHYQLFSPTAGARLGRCEPPVGHNEPATLPGRLVAELTTELGHGGVGHRLGQRAGLGHTATFRSSITNAVDMVARSWEAWWTTWRRWWAIRACSLARRALAVARPTEPFLVLERASLARLRRSSAWRRNFTSFQPPRFSTYLEDTVLGCLLILAVLTDRLVRRAEQ